MILSVGDFGALGPSRPVTRRTSGFHPGPAAATAADRGAIRRAGVTAHGRPPPVLGDRTVWAMLWIVFVVSALQWVFS